MSLRKSFSRKMSASEVERIFARSDAILRGHFRLSSGLHSDTYLQCARVLQKPRQAARLCRQLVRAWKRRRIDVVVGPAFGGIILAYELARSLSARALFTERVDGKMLLRRGFEIQVGEKVLVAEDVITTGASVKEVIEVVRGSGGKVVGVASLVERGGGSKLPVPFMTLLKVSLNQYEPEECPLCQNGIPLTTPGSRKGKGR